MPIHDWTRVDAGIFHDFHQTWMPEIKRALNGCSLAGAPDCWVLSSSIAGKPAGVDVDQKGAFRREQSFFDSNLLSLGKDARESIYLFEPVGDKCVG
jgi:hypothetical protein